MALFRDEWMREDMEHDAFMYGLGREDEREPEPECDCRFSGDRADASDCELHGTIRKPMGRAASIVWANAAQKICINCKRQEARWASLYCSDRCRDAFLYFGEAV